MWEARRLSRPLDALTAAADRLGDGDFSAQVAPSGVVEIDTVARSINATADRLAVVLERERAFSADASHQLRTPLTALRLRLEGEVLSSDDAPRPALVHALEEIDRLQSTIEDLLRLARMPRATADPCAPRASSPSSRSAGGRDWRLPTGRSFSASPQRCPRSPSPPPRFARSSRCSSTTRSSMVPAPSGSCREPSRAGSSSR